MLLLPFVENAFKHGVSISEPSYIHIDLHAGDNRLDFSVENSVHARRIAGRDDNNGTGLQNVRRRLELLFGSNHELNIVQTGDKFSVSLGLVYKES
jgi:LytS/YehU family sensor histidine kinase